MLVVANVGGQLWAFQNWQGPLRFYSFLWRRGNCLSLPSWQTSRGNILCLHEFSSPKFSRFFRLAVSWLTLSPHLSELISPQVQWLLTLQKRDECQSEVGRGHLDPSPSALCDLGHLDRGETSVSPHEFIIPALSFPVLFFPWFRAETWTRGRNTSDPLYWLPSVRSGASTTCRGLSKFSVCVLTHVIKWSPPMI